MATCRLTTIHFHNSMYSFLSLFYLFFHLLLAHAIQFNYPDFPQGIGNLTFSGDAESKFSSKSLSLARNQADDGNMWSVGPVVYSEEMHLFDSVTRKPADFMTHFSFGITNLTTTGADGMTFFLAHNGSHIPENAKGECLALITNCSGYISNTTGKAIVAVEFDTWFNTHYDPSSVNHLGIDINSIQSVTSLTLNRSMNDGSRANAWITYNSTTKNLSVLLIYADNPSMNYSLSYEVDLSIVLPEWVSIGFSASTGVYAQVYYIYSWEFNSTEFNSPEFNSPEFNSTEFNSTKPGNGGGGDIGLIVGCVVGGSLIVGGIVLILVFWWRKRTRRGKKEDDAPDDSMDDEFEHGTGPRRLTYGELVQATNNFAEEGKLGQGGFGGVYRGFLTDWSLNVAVKRVSRGSKQGRKEYMAEVKIISKLRHKNLVQLVGWCHEKGELVLVYELMPNGSLDFHLFRVEGMLSWAQRYKIALGLASALLYLHEDSEQCVVHRDIKSSNVMLDSNFNVKLGDFGLARLMDQGSGLKTTGLAGTFGYMAPEYINTGKASKGSDVFSFGVVALEIACGRRSMEPKQEEAQISLVAWVWEAYGKGTLLDVADKKLCMDFDMKQMERLMIVGLWGAHPDHNLRPSIRQAIQVLNFEAPLPDLPKKMPTPRFDVPASSSSSTEPLLSNATITLPR